MKTFATAAALALITAPALAHTGLGGASGLAHGFLHPLTGPDHLLAMLAVGLWSGFVLPQRAWAGAAAFLAAMAAGAGMSWAGVPLPMIEAGITLSVVVFGLLTLAARRGQPAALTAASLATIAFFAAFHGHAHATEATGDAAGYLAGFLLATSGLHLAGIALARAAASGRFARALQMLSGAGVALGGLLLVAG